MAPTSRTSSPTPTPSSGSGEDTPRRAMLRMIAEADNPVPPQGPPVSPPRSVLGRRQRTPSPDIFTDDGPPPARRPRASTAAVFNAPAFAKSLIQNKKVQLDNPTPFYDFANMTHEQREIAQYGLLLEIREEAIKNKQDVAKSWAMDKALTDTIRDYTTAIMLAPILPAYMIEASVVTKLLVAKNIYPESWGVNPPRINAIRKQISDSAADRRYEIKQKIAESIKRDEYLSALCKRILNGTQLRVTPAFRGRVAFLRHQWKFNPAQREKPFWGFVDKKLKELRATVNNDATKLARAMTVFVSEDEKLYPEGKDEAYDLVTDDGSLPPLQLAAEQALAPRAPIVPNVPQNGPDAAASV